MKIVHGGLIDINLILKVDDFLFARMFALLEDFHVDGVKGLCCFIVF